MERIQGLLAAFLLVASAWALGRRLRPKAGNLAGTALGLGTISLGTLGIGWLRIPPPNVLWSLLCLGGGFAVRDLWKARFHWAGLRLDAWTSAQAGGCALILLVTAAGLPALPLDYDSLEYHLGAPAAYLREGRIRPLEDNLYAAMPENQEMLYLLVLASTRSHVAGALAAKMLNLACWMLCALTLYAFARRQGEARAGGWAALALLSSPWVLLTGGWMPYNEPGLVLYGTLAAALAWEGRAGLAGLLAGLAFGTKYPALLFVILPLFLKTRSPRFLLGTLLTASPWLLKNLLAYGNPVHPLFAGIPAWDAAHAPGGFDWTDLMTSLSHAGSGMLLAPALLLFLLFARGPLLGPLLGWVVFGISGWFCLTHRIDRFLLPLLPPLCLAIGLGIERMARLPLGRIALAVPAAALALTAWGGLLRAADALPDLQGPWEEALVKRCRLEGATYSAEALRQVNRLPRGSRVLFVGEAQTFYLRLDGDVRVVAPTVFDAKPFERDPGLGGFTHVYLNLPELNRLQTTYGDRRQGYSAKTVDFLRGLRGRTVWEAGGGRWRLLEL